MGKLIERRPGEKQMKSIVSAVILTCVVLVSMPAHSGTEKTQNSKKGTLANPYEDGMDKAATNIVNGSLGSVGKRVVITIKQAGGKEQRFYAKIPNDKYSPSGDDTAKAVLATSSMLTAAIDKAKNTGMPNTISIAIECKP